MDVANGTDIEKLLMGNCELNPLPEDFIVEEGLRSLWYETISVSLFYPKDYPDQDDDSHLPAINTPEGLIFKIPLVPPIVRVIPNLKSNLSSLLSIGHSRMMKFMEVSFDEHYMENNALNISYQEPISDGGVVVFERLSTGNRSMTIGFSQAETYQMMEVIADLHTTSIAGQYDEMIYQYGAVESPMLLEAMKESIEYIINRDEKTFGDPEYYSFVKEVLSEENASNMRNCEARGFPKVILHRDITPNSVAFAHESTMIRSLFDPCMLAVGSPGEDLVIALCLGVKADRLERYEHRMTDAYFFRLRQNIGDREILSKFNYNEHEMLQEYKRVFPFAACYAAFVLINHIMDYEEKASNAHKEVHKQKMKAEAAILLQKLHLILSMARRRWRRRESYEEPVRSRKDRRSRKNRSKGSEDSNGHGNECSPSCSGSTEENSAELDGSPDRKKLRTSDDEPYVICCNSDVHPILNDSFDEKNVNDDLNGDFHGTLLHEAADVVHEVVDEKLNELDHPVALPDIM